MVRRVRVVVVADGIDVAVVESRQIRLCLLRGVDVLTLIIFPWRQEPQEATATTIIGIIVGVAAALLVVVDAL